MSYNLFLDDVRVPYSEEHSIENAFSYMKNDIYRDLKWNIVRSYSEFVKCIEEHGLPEIVSWDHDLGPEHYKLYFKSLKSGVFNYDECIEKTGMDCVKFLVNYCIDNQEKFPKESYYHTMNPVGLENMKSYIEAYKRHCITD